MSWLDDRMEERRIKEEREGLVYSHAEQVFDALWLSIDNLIQQAHSKNLPAGTNGGPRNRIAYVSATPKRGQHSAPRRDLNLKFDQSRCDITAYVNGKILKFVIAVNEANIVGLTYEGNEIDREDAAILLVDRLLFWDLPPSTLKTGPEITPEIEEALRKLEHEEQD